jgi:hypothetical protein
MNLKWDLKSQCRGALLSTFASLTMLLTVLTGEMRADSIQPEPADWGWISSRGTDLTVLQPQFPRFSNYIVGLSRYSVAPNVSEPIEYRNFFVFVIPANVRSVSSATLHIPNPNHGYNSPQPTETVTFFDVVSPINEVMEGGTGLLPHFNDLGEGVSYGSVVVNATDVGKYINVSLNVAALSDIQSARGDLWAIGGKLTTIGSGPFETVFGNTPVHDLPYLTLEAQLIPEPTARVLLYSAVAVVFASSRRWQQ